jgi:hypothetical protein
MDYVIWNREFQSVELRLLLQDCNSVLEIGKPNIGYHSPLEPADQPGFQTCNF